jgi:hypothetical protein
VDVATMQAPHSGMTRIEKKRQLDSSIISDFKQLVFEALKMLSPCLKRTELS